MNDNVGQEQAIHNALLQISTMREGIEKNMLTTALRAHGGSFCNALAACQVQAKKEFIEAGYSNVAANKKAAEKYPLLFE